MTRVFWLASAFTLGMGLPALSAHASLFGSPQDLFAVQLVRLARAHKKACQDALRLPTEPPQPLQSDNPWIALQGAIEMLEKPQRRAIGADPQPDLPELTGTPSRSMPLGLIVRWADTDSDANRARILNRLAGLEQDIQDPSVLAFGLVHHGGEVSDHFNSVLVSPQDDLATLQRRGSTFETMMTERFRERQNQERLLALVPKMLGVSAPVPVAHALLMSFNVKVTAEIEEIFRTGRLNMDILDEECRREVACSHAFNWLPYNLRRLRLLFEQGRLPRYRSLLYDQLLIIDGDLTSHLITYVRLLPENHVFSRPRRLFDNSQLSWREENAWAGAR